MAAARMRSPSEAWATAALRGTPAQRPVGRERRADDATERGAAAHSTSGVANPLHGPRNHKLTQEDCYITIHLE